MSSTTFDSYNFITITPQTFVGKTTNAVQYNSASTKMFTFKITGDNKQTKKWNYLEATEENLKKAWNEFKNGNYLNAIITVLEGAETPEGLITGEAPCFAFKGINLMQLLKNLPNLFKNIKKIKSFKDFLNFFRKAFGIRQKLNSQSFVGDKPNKNLPYICSPRGANATFNYKDKNYIYYNEKIVDGFRDGGRGATYDRFGKILYADREVITIDREVDQYLANAIKYVKRETQNMNEEQKLKFIYKTILDISGDAVKSVSKSEKMARANQGNEVLLGDVFAAGAACCRHKGLMFKILADEVGLKAKVVRGIAVDAFGQGGHVWNEIRLSNGKKFVVDTQNNHLIDLSTAKGAKNLILKGYYTADGQPVY